MSWSFSYLINVLNCLFPNITVNNMCGVTRHFSSTKKDLLVGLVTPYKTIIEDKRKDNETLDKKAKVWEQIRQNFVGQPGVQSDRTAEQL